MHLSRRSLLLTPLALSAPAYGQSLTKLTVGITAGSGMLPPLVARAKGMFAAHGLDATLTRVAFVGLMPPALLSGTFQIGIGTAPTLLQATEGGLDLVAVCGETRMTADNPSASLVVKAGSGITKPADLISKKVGMTGVNGIFDQLFHRWLLDQHVPADKVQIIEMAFPTMHDALRSGAVDAVAAFRAVIAEAIAFIDAHHDEAKAIEVKETGVTSPFTPTFATAVKPADFVFYGEIGKQLKLLQDVPKPEALILK